MAETDAGRAGRGARQVLPVAGWAWLWRDFEAVLGDGAGPEMAAVTRQEVPADAEPGAAEPVGGVVAAVISDLVRGSSSDVLDSGCEPPVGLRAA
ncbi:hypothetical protein [Streptomyces prasinosporus]|uniref:hypothetical protein n=1 Tax=Streptomyces prasinosporus TaxID=68256 RepID=UPI0031E7C15E